MVYVVLKSYYPTNKAEEVLKIFMELVKKYPPDDSIAETLIRGAGTATEEGYKSMSIWKVKEGQFDKLAKRIMGAMSMFNNVEGFGWKVRVWSTFEESAAIR
ncbi:MAG: hypothetical protein ACFE8L_11045 [Candidatus Hodarchaeota archaeon]